MITIPNPFDHRGYVTQMVITDVKSLDDYVVALGPFCRQLVATLQNAGIIAADAVRWHCDEEDAVTKALLHLVGGVIIGCRFHKMQNLESHFKAAFPKK